MIYEFLHHIRVKIMYEWILLSYNVRRTNKKKEVNLHITRVLRIVFHIS